jgi:hypothetical protein
MYWNFVAIDGVIKNQLDIHIFTHSGEYTERTTLKWIRAGMLVLQAEYDTWDMHINTMHCTEFLSFMQIIWIKQDNTIIKCDRFDLIA